ncbi:hypothetical protein ACFL0Z_03500 [Patescibacteria group bacterium]
MNTKLLTIFMTIALVAVLGLVMVNTAQADLVVPNNVNGTAGGDEYQLIRSVTNWILGITGAIAVLFIIYGGFRYITASGNQTMMETAKNILIKAIIGLVIIVVAYVIVTAILGALTG